MKKRKIEKIKKVFIAEFETVYQQLEAVQIDSVNYQDALKKNKELEHELFDAGRLIKQQAEEIEVLKEKLEIAKY